MLCDALFAELTGCSITGCFIINRPGTTLETRFVEYLSVEEGFYLFFIHISASCYFFLLLEYCYYDGIRWSLVSK
jgi:uncharacterized Fe-S cluster-containing protein